MRKGLRLVALAGAFAASLLAGVLGEGPARAATLTPPNLTQGSSIANGDLFLYWPVASSGPLESIQYSVLQSNLITALGSSYLIKTNNLSDVSSAATARSNLGLGTAATNAIGTSAGTLCLLNTACTWSGAQTLSAKLTLFASTTAGAPFNIPQGVAPTSPTNGDFWTTSTEADVRIAGVTQLLASQAFVSTSYAPIASPTFTGTPAAPTPTALDNSTKIATTAFVDSANTTGSAAILTTGRTIAITGDLAYTSPSFNGSGNVTAAGTLATVNSNVGSFGGVWSIPSFTVNAKGLITAAAANTPTIPSATVTLAMMANETANTILGNNTGSAAAPIALTNAQVAAALTGTGSNTLAARKDSRVGGPTQNSQSANYTLALTDAGGQIYHPSTDTTARTLTIPANGSVAFAVGAKVDVVNDCSAGTLTISITTDTMVWFPSGSTGTRTLAACGEATLSKVTSTRWAITGVGLT